MRHKSRCLQNAIMMLIVASVGVVAADDATQLPSGSKVYLAPMDGFENYLVASIQSKDVPLTVVANRNAADFEITGTSTEKKAGAAKIIFGSGLPEVDASVTVTNLKTGVVAFAFS